MLMAKQEVCKVGDMLFSFMDGKKICSISATGANCFRANTIQTDPLLIRLGY